MKTQLKSEYTYSEFRELMKTPATFDIWTELSVQNVRMKEAQGQESIPALAFLQEKGVLVDAGTRKQISAKGENAQWVSPIVYAINKGLEIDEEPALLYAIKKDILLDGKPPLAYAIENNIKIEGQDPLVYCFSNQIEVEVKATKGVQVNEQEQPRSVPVAEHIWDDNFKIGDKTAVEYLKNRKDIKIPVEVEGETLELRATAFEKVYLSKKENALEAKKEAPKKEEPKKEEPKKEAPKKEEPKKEEPKKEVPKKEVPKKEVKTVDTKEVLKKEVKKEEVQPQIQPKVESVKEEPKEVLEVDTKPVVPKIVELEKKEVKKEEAQPQIQPKVSPVIQEEPKKEEPKKEEPKKEEPKKEEPKKEVPKKEVKTVDTKEVLKKEVKKEEVQPQIQPKVESVKEEPKEVLEVDTKPVVPTNNINNKPLVNAEVTPQQKDANARADTAMYNTIKAGAVTVGLLAVSVIFPPAALLAVAVAAYTLGSAAIAVYREHQAKAFLKPDSNNIDRPQRSEGVQNIEGKTTEPALGQNMVKNEPKQAQPQQEEAKKEAPQREEPKRENTPSLSPEQKRIRDMMEKEPLDPKMQELAIKRKENNKVEAPSAGTKPVEGKGRG